jgi:hypothetical protein
MGCPARRTWPRHGCATSCAPTWRQLAQNSRRALPGPAARSWHGWRLRRVHAGAASRCAARAALAARRAPHTRGPSERMLLVHGHGSHPLFDMRVLSVFARCRCRCAGGAAACRRATPAASQSAACIWCSAAARHAAW